MRGAVLVVLVAMLAGCLDARAPAPDLPEAYTDEPPPEPQNLWLLEGPRPALDQRVSSGAEPQVLADKQGKYLWIADTSGGYRSADNGTSWKRMPTPFLLTADGWSLAQDDEGVLYASTTSVPWIDVYRSDDDGTNWDQLSGRFVEVAPVADRPWIAAHGDGELVLFHYDFGRTFSESCARSTDGGLTWADRSVFQASPQGGRASTDDAGNFYISSDDGTLYRFAGSCLGPQSKTMFPGKGAQHMVHSTAIRDEVYVAAPTSGNGAIMVAGTKDWGRPKTVTIAPDVLASNTFAVVSAHGDEVAVAWYGSETSGDPSAASFNGAWNVYVAVIKDFWGTPMVDHVRVTTEPNHVGDICMGGVGCDGSRDRDLLDYFAIDHDIWGGIHVAYGHDGSGSNAEVRHAHLLPGQLGTTPDLPDEGEEPTAAGPTAAFEMGSEGLTVHVDASGATGDGLSYGWSWGDGTTSTGRTAEHTYAEAGAYRVRLVVVDAAGRSDHEERGVVVAPQASSNEAPTAGFQVEGERRVDGTVRFTDTSTDDGAIAERSWDLGDGTVKQGEHVTHRYAEPGRYQVTLTVTDDAGATGTATATVPITIAARPAEAPQVGAPWPLLALPLALALAAARRRA